MYTVRGQGRRLLRSGRSLPPESGALSVEGWQHMSPLKLAASGLGFPIRAPPKGTLPSISSARCGDHRRRRATGRCRIDRFLPAHLLRRLRIDHLSDLQLNTLGDGKSRQAWRRELISYLESLRRELSPESQTRLNVNPLRVLDSKEEVDQQIIRNAPPIEPFLTYEARTFFEEVKRELDCCRHRVQVEIPG